MITGRDPGEQNATLRKLGRSGGRGQKQPLPSSVPSRPLNTQRLGNSSSCSQAAQPPKEGLPPPEAPPESTHPTPLGWRRKPWVEVQSPPWGAQLTCRLTWSTGREAARGWKASLAPLRGAGRTLSRVGGTGGNSQLCGASRRQLTEPTQGCLRPQASTTQAKSSCSPCTATGVSPSTRPCGASR